MMNTKGKKKIKHSRAGNNNQNLITPQPNYNFQGLKRKEIHQPNNSSE